MKLLGAWLYPVKGMRAVATSVLALDAKGVVGDRRWMVVDPQGRFLTQRTAPGLARLQPSLLPGGLQLEDAAGALQVAQPTPGGPRLQVTVWKDTLPALDGGDDAAAWLTARLSQPCRLVAFAPDVRRAVDPRYAQDAETSFTDGYPLLVVNEASLDALNAELEVPVPMERFRPNLVVRASDPWVEDGWTRLEVDGLPLDAVKPCARCVVINTDQHTGARPQGAAPLTALTRLHARPGGAIFGQNLVHRAQGPLRVGAHVEAK